MFTIVGFVLGAYSRYYTSVSFFPMKLILAIPYKISEAIYVSIIGTDAAHMMARRPAEWHWYFTEFFPHSTTATFMAEICTTFFIGGAIYGALAYFTGDKRVFTMQRFLKFGVVWCGVILMTVGAAYLVNAKAIHDNENLEGEPSFKVYNSEGKGTNIRGGEDGQLIREYFYSELKEMDIVRDYEEELSLGIIFDSVRYSGCSVNYKEQYLVTEQGRTYHISGEFAQIIRQFEEEGMLPPELSGGEMCEEILRP